MTNARLFVAICTLAVLQTTYGWWWTGIGRDMCNLSVERVETDKDGCTFNPPMMVTSCCGGCVTEDRMRLELNQTHPMSTCRCCVAAEILDLKTSRTCAGASQVDVIDYKAIRKCCCEDCDNIRNGQQIP